MTNEELPQEELLKRLEAVTRGDGLSPSEGEFAEMGLAWKTLSEGLMHKGFELTEDQDGFADRLKDLIGGESGAADWEEEAELSVPHSGVSKEVVERGEQQRPWSWHAFIWVGTGVCAAAIAVFMWSVWPASEQGTLKEPIAKVPQGKAKSEGEPKKKSPPLISVEGPKVVKGLPPGGKKSVKGKQEGLATKTKGKDKWTDPLDVRIEAAATKLRKKPVALAGSTDYSLRKLDKRVSALAKSMSQEKL